MKKIVTQETETRYCDAEGCDRVADTLGNPNFDYCYYHKPLYDLAILTATNSLDRSQHEARKELADNLFDMMLKEYKKFIERK